MVNMAPPFQRKLTSAIDVRAQSATPKLKKRHVERLTRLPTKRLATACWWFIVAKSIRLQTAPMLDFLSLQDANSEIYAHVINKKMWTAWGYLPNAAFIANFRCKPCQDQLIASDSNVNF